MNSNLGQGGVLRVAVWFGLVTGLVEGVGLVALQKLDWLNWNIAKVPVSVEIIWIAALFNLLLCLAGALFLILLGRMFPRLPLLRVAVFCFALFAVLDWLLLSGRIRESGAAVLAIGLATVFLRWWRRNEEHALLLWKRTLPGVIAAFVLAAAGIEGTLWWQERNAEAGLPAADPAAPNVLVIVVDTLRADHLSSYGYPRATSPQIDRLVREGVAFESGIATSSWTLPSHASMLTGRAPHEHGAEVNYFPERFPTLAEALRDRGYRTGAFSANTIWFSRQRGFGRGFIHFEDYFTSAGDMFARTVYGRKIQSYILIPLGYEDDPGRKRAPDVTRAALDWMEANRNRPFFAFLNYYDAHDPYLPPEPFRSKFSKRENPGGRLNTLVGRYYPTMTPEQLQGELDAYDGGIAYADHHIGELVAGLERSGRAANTLVVITSDHGESFGEHGLLLHINALYREVVHVPVILRWPGHLPAGTRISQPVSIATLPATILDLLGDGGQEVFPGPSLAGYWQNPQQAPQDHYPLAELAQFPHKEIQKNPCYSGALKSLVSPEWHYITHEKLGEELYDWQKDPQELSNLAGTPEGRERTAEFAGVLRRLIEEKKNARAQAAEVKQ